MEGHVISESSAPDTHSAVESNQDPRETETLCYVLDVARLFPPLAADNVKLKCASGDAWVIPAVLSSPVTV